MVIPPLYKLWILLLAIVIDYENDCVTIPQYFSSKLFPHGSPWHKSVPRPSWWTLCFPLQHQVWRSQIEMEHGDGSKPWYLVNPKIAGKWMFIPLNSCWFPAPDMNPSGQSQGSIMFKPCFWLLWVSENPVHLLTSLKAALLNSSLKSQFWQIPNWKWCFGWDVSTIKHHGP